MTARNGDDRRKPTNDEISKEAANRRSGIQGRKKKLQKWVEQPSVEPNIQYLRDAEHTFALDQLGEHTHVLDIASESSVTSKIEAKKIARVDFSPKASAKAKEVLGEKVEEYSIVDLRDPVLPFDDDSFDGIISIGPYDWKFLNVGKLTDEVHRVGSLHSDFVFSVPTIRSPYRKNGINQSRYYTKNSINELISPYWHLDSSKLIFQYPYPIHNIINQFPEDIQEKFVKGAYSLTEVLNKLEWWKRASYVVLNLTPLKYEYYLNKALGCLFRSVEENGFWDDESEQLVRALTYRFEDGTLEWGVDTGNEWRYAPFALIGILHWRNSSLATSEYDEQIQRELSFFQEAIKKQSLLNEIPSYGVGPLITAFSLAASIYSDKSYLESARQLFYFSINEFNFNNSEDSLLLYGWTFLYAQTHDTEVLTAIEKHLWELNERFTTEGLFHFSDGKTRRHQNQMYILWSICRSIEVTGKQGYLENVEQVLEYTIRNRMQNDGAFIWEDVSLPHKTYEKAVNLHSGQRSYREFLYECHQTFFVNAVAHYYRAGGRKNYNKEVRKSMEWIYGGNTRNLNLADCTGIGVPLRQMTVRGEVDAEYFAGGTRNQLYKGVYEVGSYLMALTNLLDGPIADRGIAGYY